MKNLTNDGDICIDWSSKLGSGAYGDVYKGMWKSKNKLIAIKRIKDEHKDSDVMMKEQVEIMRNFQHENVLNFLEIVNNQQGLFIIIEYCQGGNLAAEIEKQTIPELNCFLYFKQMVDGMVEINKMQHIHRDLKPENILFSKYKVLKICDFGLARRIIGTDVNKMEKYSAKGTPLYASPQLLLGEMFSGKCDVWSVGLILVEMLTKQCPVYNRAKVNSISTLSKYQREITQKTGHYVFEGNYNQWFKDIVAKMVAYEEKDRATFLDIQKIIQKDFQRIQAELSGFTNFGNLDKLGVGTTVLTDSLVELVPEKPNQTYNELQEQNRMEELANNLNLYLKYLYNRAKMFVDIATRLYNQKSELNGAVKYIVLYLSIGIYLKTIESLQNLMTKVKKIQLPNGSIVDDRIFNKLDGSYLELLGKEKVKFYETIVTINSKLTNEKYTTGYGSLLQKNNVILSELANLAKKQSTLKAEDFQRLYLKFIAQECTKISKNNFDNESFGRLYWLVLKLADLEETLPLKEFTNIYIINNLTDQSLKTPYPKIVSMVEQLQKQVAS